MEIQHLENENIPLNINRDTIYTGLEFFYS